MEKHSRSRTEYLVKARSQFKDRSTATSVEIMLPLPPDAITPVVRTSQVRKQPCKVPQSCLIVSLLHAMSVQFVLCVGQCDVCPREGCFGMEDQEFPRRQRVFAALQVWLAIRGGGGRGARPHAARQSKIRDSLLHCVGDAGEMQCGTYYCCVWARCSMLTNLAVPPCALSLNAGALPKGD